MHEFGHIDTYAGTPKAGKGGAKRSAREILAEAARVPANCPHVAAPQPPRVVAGMHPGELAERHDDIVRERLEPGKRKPRGDIHTLAAAVYSWPEHTDYHNSERLQGWMADQIEWHRQHVGPVDSAVLHLDESHPHLHIYTVDPDARRLVPGWQAKRAANAGGATGKEANKAYRDQMKAWQDRLYEDVGRYHGLDRLGPKRQRLTRPEYRAAKAERLEAADRLRAARDAATAAHLQAAAAEFEAKLRLEAAEAAAAAALAEAERVAAEKAAAAELSRKQAVEDGNKIREDAREHYMSEGRRGFADGKNQAIKKVEALRPRGLAWIADTWQKMTGKAEAEATAAAAKAKAEQAQQKLTDAQATIEGLRATVARKDELKAAAERELNDIKNPPKPVQSRPETEPTNRNRMKP